MVIGAGIVGAATALQLSYRQPKASIAIVEKEPQAASHQTGRNSGVIHAGVYYQPGSLKAQFCRQGLERTVAFCQQHQIPYQQCGKLIVATHADEEERLATLYQRCEANQLEPQLYSQQQVAAVEPNVNAHQAIWVQQSGITDYVKITQTILSLAKAQGVDVWFDYRVDSIDESSEGLTLTSLRPESPQLECQFLINCAGIYADRIIELAGDTADFALLPFRGEYFRLSKRLDNVVNRLIYPVPDPALPFLGVHLTPMIGGYLTVGPNAVLAGGKEAYNTFEFNLSDLISTLRYRGSWPLFKQYWSSGLGEMRDSIWRAGYLKRVQQYCPSVELADLLPYRAGIRAQAVNPDGSLEHDFRFVRSARCLHVGNAPSPAATSAFPIADEIVNHIMA